jgi:acyl-CoA reductase-like NAD-dependent aldehyde dehydrogenase
MTVTETENKEFKMLINGRLVPGFGRPFAVLDPATGEPITAECPHASEQQVNEAAEGSHAALKLWSNLPLDERKKFLERMVCALESHGLELAELLSHEQGKPLANARSEVMSAIASAKEAQKIEIPIKKVGTTSTHSLEIHRKPIGVVAAIIPWNYPVHIALMKIVHALVFGNTVIIKPSPYTPLSTLKIAEYIAPVFPIGVVNIVTGPDTRDEKCVGDQLARHPKVSLVAFTGSIATGKRVFHNCSGKMSRMVLELGGNDPAIVLKDADVERAAEGVFEGAMINSGQICCGIKRVYVHSSTAELFISKLGQLAQERVIKIGRGLDEGVTMGPLNNEMQFKRVSELVDDAIANGAKLHAGGKKPAHVDQKGFFFEPTVLSNVHEGMRIVDEEQFGPVIPVLTYETEEEAITSANATKYGLGASVWGSNAETVNRVATQLEAGIVWTNEHAADGPGLAFGGFKESGIGREGGEYDLLTYTECQSVKLML